MIRFEASGFSRAIILSVAACSCAVLNAQEPLSLKQAVERAEKNLLYQAKLQRLEAVGAQVLQADRRPNPVLETEFETGAITGSPDHLVSVGFLQIWERGGKRTLRRQIAESELEQAQFELEEYRTALEAAIQTAYFDSLEAEAEISLLSSYEREVENLLAYDRVRVQEGEIPVMNTEHLRAELSRLELMREELKNRSQQARYSLNTLMGAELEASFRLTAESRQLKLPPLEKVQDFALNHRAVLKETRSSLAQAQLQVKLEKANAKLDWEIGVGYHRIHSRTSAEAFRPEGIITSATDTSNLLELKLNIPLPLWNNNSGNLATAIASGKSLEKELSYLQMLVRQAVGNAYREIRLHQQLQAVYDDRLMDNLRSNSQRLEAAYKLTGEDVLDLIDQKRELLEAALRKEQTPFALRKAVAKLEKEMGGQLSEIGDNSTN